MKSKDNPADLISRGATPQQLQYKRKVDGGPQWLNEHMESWPKEDEDLSINDVPEMRKQAIIAMVVTYKTVINYRRFLSLNKLLRTTAYVLRFVHNIRCKKQSREIGEIANEISSAKIVIS